MKKIISLVCSAAMVLTMFTALCVTSFVSAASPLNFKAVRISSELSTKEMLDKSKYNGADDILVNVSCSDEGHTATGATGIARVGYTDQALYVWVRADDSTRSSEINEDKPWENDSVEIFVDFNNNKADKNPLTGSKSYAMQYRINRQGQYDGGNKSSSVDDIADAAQPAGSESGTYYTVAVRIPFKAGKTDARPVSTKIGFAVQINDNMDNDDTRDAKTCTSTRAGQAHSYTSHFETLELPDFTNLATRTVETQVASNTTTVSHVSNALVSSSKSNTSSKATSSAVTTSTTGTSSDGTTTTVSDAQTTGDPTETVESEGQTDDGTETIGAVDTSKPDDGDEGGLPLGALIGIIAGAVVLLAGIAVAIIVIIKKKKAA